MDNIQNTSVAQTEIDEEINSSKNDIDKREKIRRYINEGNFSAILPLLSKEDRNDFIETIVEVLDERNSKLFFRKLEELGAETLDEAKKRRIFEDLQATIALKDMVRSKKNTSLRNEMTSQINELKQKNSNGEYLTIGDKHFLEDHDEDAFNISEQSRINNSREERYNNFSQLGKINAFGENDVNRDRIFMQINELIREKYDFLSHGGDLNNSVKDFDRQINQLYAALDDVKKMNSTLEHFYGERDKQRQLDASIRGQQVNAMHQANQKVSPDAVQEDSIGGMSR